MEKETVYKGAAMRPKTASGMKHSEIKQMREWNAFHLSGFFAFILGWALIIWSFWQVWLRFRVSGIEGFFYSLANLQRFGLAFTAFIVGWILLSGLFINGHWNVFYPLCKRYQIRSIKGDPF